ncbi:MAG TPA: hypothetical protein VN238_19620 [Solirubrobacteraceae bacterium]|nr:hypothetical protein [Solirubrobacteraceae bacterium]
MRPVLLFVTVAATALLGVAAAPAAAEEHAAAALLKDDVARVAKKTDVPVRVPQAIDLDFDGQVFGSGTATKRSYALGLDATEDCGGANACFLASFTGERGGSYAFTRKVTLARGITGRYKPLSCGASCAPAMVEWKQGGALYTIQAKVGVAGAAAQRAALVRAANSAITATPR